MLMPMLLRPLSRSCSRGGGGRGCRGLRTCAIHISGASVSGSIPMYRAYSMMCSSALGACLGTQGMSG